MSRRQICKWALKCTHTIPRNINIRPIRSVALKLKELDESIVYKPKELLDYIYNKHRFTHHTKYICIYNFWLSAPLFDNLRKDIFQIESFKKYKSFQSELKKLLYKEDKLQDWEKDLLKRLKKENKLYFKNVLIEAFAELGMHFPNKWDKRLTQKFLALPDFEFIMFTSFYFSANFSKKLKQLLWSYYYRYITVKNPICSAAREKVKKIIDLEALDRII
jgi:Fe2+ transport system protein B